jgi:hypothetical protein
MLGDQHHMTASVPAPVAAGWLAGSPERRGLVSRVVAGSLFLASGVAVVASVVGIGVAQAIVSRGTIVADANDVAMLNTLAPVAFLFGLIGGLHVIAGFGIIFGSRQAAGLGIGLGVFDLVAGIVALLLAATSNGRFDSTGIAMTFLLLGIVLAVAARVADWNTYGPLTTDEAPEA